MSANQQLRTNRRSFIQGAVVTGAYALVPTLVRAEQSKRNQEDAPLIQLAQRPANYESVRSTFTTRITPTERFYIRSHFDAPVVDPTTYQLSIGGLVDKPLTFSLAELTRMKQVSVEAVLQCAGNGRALLQPRLAGVQWRRGAVGNAVWGGVRLLELLKRAGIDPKASMLQLTGADVPTNTATPRFIRGLPLA
jgi:DMSO/TMAO reductase YedYZ molybdopterin-dependent catalytic subunit